MTANAIEILGARVNNLRGISLSIPLRQRVVICGVSGSGKSSLAFDALYAEAQRRYLETVSPKVRQRLDRLPKPDVDRIAPLPPAVALRHLPPVASGRHTAASLGNVLDLLSLAMARIGSIVCPECERPIRRETPADVLSAVETLPEGTRFQLAFPIDTAAEPDWASALQTEGFDRIVVDQTTTTVREAADTSTGEVLVIVDRLVAGKTSPERIAESAELAYASGGDHAVVLSAEESGERTETIDGREWRRVDFTGHLRCGGCDLELLPPEPRLLRFTTPLGRCDDCEGQGIVSIKLGRGKTREEQCPTCHGDRYGREAVAVRVAGRSVVDLLAMTVDEASTWCEALPGELPDHEREAITLLREELLAELARLRELDLGHLPLDRGADRLSEGERRRLALAAVIGGHLVNTLFLLDEPAAGLHPLDQHTLSEVLRSLETEGNTILIIEHAPTLVRSATTAIEIGPGAGADGGEVIFTGSPEELANAETPSGRMLRGEFRESFSQGGTKSSGALTVKGCRANNLTGFDVTIPLGQFCVVAGRSGSGKTSLLQRVLFPAVTETLTGEEPTSERTWQTITLPDGIDDVALLDRSPLGGSSRSNPVTFLKAFDDIRKVFAATADARLREMTAKTFSFNASGGGRCPRCGGQGQITIDLEFLSDTSIPCPECEGTRYRPEVLEVKYRSRSIADVLAMSVTEAFPFFREHGKIQRRLQVLKDVGLGYIRLGQTTDTLSGGETQRLKLAGYLASATKKRTLFLMDEPTTGLHAADVEVLLKALCDLVAIGHSLVIAEHDPQVLRTADWILELGPGTGPEGGTIVASGSPGELRSCAESITGQHILAKA